MITYPKITTNEKNKSEFEKKISNSGLPFEVKFCKKCVISNQRPTSTKEYKHTPNLIKETISFNEDGICDACYVRKLKEKKRMGRGKEKRKKGERRGREKGGGEGRGKEY